jgi:hypothetical protein
MNNHPDRVDGQQRANQRIEQPIEAGGGDDARIDRFGERIHESVHVSRRSRIRERMRTRAGQRGSLGNSTKRRLENIAPFSF